MVSIRWFLFDDLLLFVVSLTSIKFILLTGILSSLFAVFSLVFSLSSWSYSVGTPPYAMKVRGLDDVRVL